MSPVLDLPAPLRRPVVGALAALRATLRAASGTSGTASRRSAWLAQGSPDVVSHLLVLFAGEPHRPRLLNRGTPAVAGLQLTGQEAEHLAALCRGKLVLELDAPLPSPGAPAPG